MTLDFTLLSMSELRNRPGDLLDRVADNGEAFIIERNGQRKACLVPLSVFLPDISPSRIADEIEELVKNGEESRCTISNDREVVFLFMYNADNNSPIEVRVVLPHGYPSTCPRVYANSIHKEAPHRWSDGALCLYGVMTGWNPGKHTVFSTLQLSRQWLQHYESWTKNGKWPNSEGLQGE
jgi:prevent-host-death family protein